MLSLASSENELEDFNITFKEYLNELSVTIEKKSTSIDSRYKEMHNLCSEYNKIKFHNENAYTNDFLRQLAYINVKLPKYKEAPINLSFKTIWVV